MQGRHPLAKLGSIAAATLLLALSPALAEASGEKIDGYPNWDERVLLELTNRARVDPQVEMDLCGDNCTEAACYSVKTPLYLNRKNSRAARFHGANMKKMGFFGHSSKCTLKPDIADLWDNGCDGSVECSCAGGQASCNPTCNTAQSRVGLFGSNYFGEIIAGGGSPNQAFYLWLYESAGGNDACMFTQDNGHRWLLLTAGSGVGFGAQDYYVGDFGGADPDEKGKIASGAHWPRGGNNVEAWANWYDQGGGPTKALINLDGACSPMSLERGSADNGAYFAQLSDLGQGCHRYYYVFEDGQGETVTYPSAGSLGIGQAGACDDWTEERPALGEGCDCAPQCGGKECGDDGCGGSCGECDAPESCEGSVCVCVPACEDKECGDDSCGGSCGPCGVDQTCQAGLCVGEGDTGGTCTPQCDGRECGDDSCGGSCGECAGDLSCQGGSCVSGDGSSGGGETSAGSGSGSDAGSESNGDSGGSATASDSAPTEGSASDGQALPNGYGDGPEDDSCACRSGNDDPSLAAGAALLLLLARRRRRCDA